VPDSSPSGGGSTQLTVERDGRKEVVDVASDLSSVTVGGRSFPVRIVARSPIRVELEIGGERIVIDRWPDHFPEPPEPVDVGGERWKVSVRAERSAPAPALTEARPIPPGDTSPGSPPATGPLGAIPILPPMPGKVVDVRVRDGDPVRKGDVLLHLEAMKMSNEITSPADGTVRDVRVAPGTNVRSREPMLYVLPSA
jgi:glutaconyl-CoA/methylmalonyl-CoA decarboxylase subunit gamma